MTYHLYDADGFYLGPLRDLTQARVRARSAKLPCLIYFDSGQGKQYAGCIQLSDKGKPGSKPEVVFIPRKKSV